MLLRSFSLSIEEIGYQGLNSDVRLYITVNAKQPIRMFNWVWLIIICHKSYDKQFFFQKSKCELWIPEHE